MRHALATPNCVRRPAPWEHYEPMHAFWPAHDLDAQSQLLCGPLHHGAPLRTIRPDRSDLRVLAPQPRQQYPRGVTILEVPAGDDCGQEHSVKVYRDAPFAPVDLLAASYPREVRATVSAARTVWESMTLQLKAYFADTSPVTSQARVSRANTCIAHRSPACR